MAHELCTCGNSETHRVAKRQTADGISVAFWSDGAVTTHLGVYVIRGARGVAGRSALDAAWLVASEVELYDWSELRKLCVTARKAVAQCSLEPRRYLRQAMAGAKFQAIKRGRVIRHARACECPRCERERLACGGTAPFRGPRRIGL